MLKRGIESLVGAVPMVALLAPCSPRSPSDPDRKKQAATAAAHPESRRRENATRSHDIQRPAESDARRREHRTMNRRQKMVGDHPKVHGASDEWEVDEALRRSLEGLPLQPGKAMLTALSELKPHVEDALQTLALLQRRKPLSDYERRQADTLRKLLTSIKHTLADQMRR
jgi:hypothetical protein